MKTCHVCGRQVDDKELTCPDCGATVVKATGGLSLKQTEVQKKVSNPMGTTISTGSGLTDILRADGAEIDESDDPYMSGSIPISLAKNTIEEEARRKKRRNSRLIGTILKVVFIAAALFGVYYFVVHVVLKKEGAFTYEEALDLYVEAVNEQDETKMELIIPSYYTYKLDEAKYLLEDMSNVHIDEYSIISKEAIDKHTLNTLQEEIKLTWNRTANIREGYTLTVQMKGTVTNVSGTSVSKGYSVEMDFLRIDDRWYFLFSTFNDSVFDN